MKPYPHLLATLTTLVVTSCVGSSDVTDPTDDPNADLVCTIPTEHIVAAAARDGIPSLNNPDLSPLGVIPFQLLAEDRTLGVVVNGEARAYPLPIMWWHEVVNDTLGGVPILVSYCPLTGSGIAFDPRVDGQLRNFGVSGALYRTNLMMFDRESETLWNQMLLGSQCGVDRGKELDRVPIVETTIGQWLEMYPNSTILTTATGFSRDYTSYPYGDYADLDNEFVTWLPPGVTWSKRRPAKELVLGVFDGWNGACRVSSGCFATAFPFGMLEEDGGVVVLNEEVGPRPVLVTYQKQRRQAIAFDRTVDGQTLSFEVVSAVPFTFRDVETGSTWDETGLALDGPLAGQQLGRITDSYVAFWFAWSIYFPNLKPYR